MPKYIIPQPNGNYDLFSTITDTIVLKDVSLQDIEDFTVEQAVIQIKEEAKTAHIRTIEKLEKDGPYMTYKEANKMHKKNSQ